MYELVRLSSLNERCRDLDTVLAVTSAIPTDVLDSHRSKAQLSSRASLSLPEG